MRRLHLLEIEDLPGCPAVFRDAMTDYLRFVLEKTQPYAAVGARLSAALQAAGAERVLDLCSGGGGPWPGLLKALDGEGEPIRVCLTDRYPNLEAFRRAADAARGRIEFEPEPVDAAAVPERLSGFRTLFTAFHHFPPETARRILADAVRQRQGIGIFEATERSVPVLLGMLLVPLIVLLVTPAIRPFRWSHLFWTYLLPVVPLAACFDGLVSCLRTYTPKELRELVDSLGETGYHWEIGREPTPGSAASVTYLIGYPQR